MRHNPQPQEMYRHFKGNPYQVRCLAKHSETGEMMVVYQAMYGDFQIYARPLSSFMEEVDREKYPDAAQRYRFELMGRESESHTDADMHAADITVADIQSTDMPITDTHAMDIPIADTHAVDIQAADMPIADIHAADLPAEQYETQEELNIDPLVLQFLDADSYERRLEILSMLHNRIDDDMINIMAVAVDIEVKEGDIEDRYEELKNCLLTFKRYECSRLRQI